MKTPCRNCGTTLVGSYCHECGQKRSTSHVPLRELLAEVSREALLLERRLLTTLWYLIAKPGQLTAAYLEGRRTEFVPPIRLYLLASVVFGAALAFSDDTVVVTLQGAEPDRTAWLRYWLWSVLLMMPIFAGLMMLVIRRGHYYVEHLVFAIHFHAFAFVVSSIALPVLEITRSPMGLGIVLMLPPVILMYLVIAVRRRYGLTLKRAILASLAVSFAYVFVQFAAFLGTGVLTDRFLDTP